LPRLIGVVQSGDVFLVARIDRAGDTTCTLSALSAKALRNRSGQADLPRRRKAQSAAIIASRFIIYPCEPRKCAIQFKSSVQASRLAIQTQQICRVEHPAKQGLPNASVHVPRMRDTSAVTKRRGVFPIRTTTSGLAKAAWRSKRKHHRDFGRIGVRFDGRRTAKKHW
jgi:hypothetical protein